MKRCLSAAMVALLTLMTAAVCSAYRPAPERKELREVTHIFTHALVADTALAFAKDNTMRAAYDVDCITASEFRAILHSLYERNYMLVDVHSVYNGTEIIPFDFPEGKKPLVLSFDDINYYVKKMYRGMNDKLVLSGGRVGSLLNGSVSFDNEVVGILNNFVAQHPDFSYKGAKGILCLTGFDGILGYRTQSGSVNRAAEIAAVTPLVQRLKELGWRFACHSYGHYHMRKISAAKFISDTDKWLREVQPLVGATDIYVYPYGEYEIEDEHKNASAKHEYLRKRGFNLFCGVGNKPYFVSFKDGHGKALLMDRIPFDGYSLRNRKKEYARFFDFDDVFDFESRP